jgi:hypothetical protein
MVSNVRASIGVGLLVGLTLSLLMWGLSASPAQAETLTDCQADIDQAKALLTDTTNPNYIDSFTNEKDREGLVGKLDSASTKLWEGKTEDALAILISLRDIKVPTLVSQGKLEQEDADVLLVEINEAIGSIEGLQAQTPTAA